MRKQNMFRHFGSWKQETVCICHLWILWKISDTCRDMSVHAYLIKFDCLVANLESNNIKLSESMLSCEALKSANLSKENERWVRATVNESNLQTMSEQLTKFMKPYYLLIIKFQRFRLKEEM